jgi:hypothetical protein
MKRIALFLLISIGSQAQDDATKFVAEAINFASVVKKDVKAELAPHDLGVLFSNPSSVMGFIGTDYQRLRIRFISVIRNAGSTDQYMVYGKSMVKDNVCEFQGSLKVRLVYYVNDPEFKDVRQGIIVGDYQLFENPAQKHVGTFKGSFVSSFYIDKQGKLQYNDLMGGADGFTNNQFVGTWSGYAGKSSKPCNWGDSRIPMSGDLDTGAGEFYPNKKYVANGWTGYIQAYFNSSDSNAEALKKEKAEWWK